MARWLVQGKTLMGTQSHQKPHVLKALYIVDHYQKQVTQQTRLQGKWLLYAGIRPDSQVQITNPRFGELVIKSLDDQA